jgi:aminoglycoside 3-N-acetyltransferase
MGVKKTFRFFRGFSKRFAIYWDAYVMGNSISKNDILSALRLVGVKEGSTICVHSSLSRLGFVRGGPDAAISALREAVGRSGTIVMPTFSGFTKSKINSVFDVRSSESKTGIITEKFRLLPGALRSLHPTSSVAALGPNAGLITKGHEAHLRPFEKGTPLYKLMELNGDIICLGADIDTVSFYHVVEDCVENFPVKTYEPEQLVLKVIDSEGKEKSVRTYVHDLGVHEYCIDKNPAIIRRMRGLFEKNNALKSVPLGKGSVQLFNSRELMRVMENLARQNVTIYAADDEEQKHKYEKG